MLNTVKNLFAMGKNVNSAVIDDDKRWKTELNLVTSQLDQEDPLYKEKLWFYNQFYLFITDRTMVHPNPGIQEDEEYKWTIPDNIIIDNGRDWFHPAHSAELIFQLNECKDKYLQGKISIDQYCQEREELQKKDVQFIHLFRY